MEHSNKNTIEVLNFFAQFVNSIATVTADGKVGFFELSEFFRLWPFIAPAIDGVNEVPKELSNLSEIESAEIHNAFADALRLPNQGNEQMIEGGVKLALAVAEYISQIREIKNS
ncbi:MAG: hypothetical protein ACRCYO_19175 [Bacteroidia bacterium]